MKRRTSIEKNILKNAKYIIGIKDWDRRITSIFALNAKYYHGDEILRNDILKKNGMMNLEMNLGF